MPVQKWQLGAGAGVLVLAVAGGVGYTVLNKPAPAPAPVVAAAPAAAPAPAPVNLAPTDNDPVAEFAATTDAAVVTTATAAYLAPNLNAPQFYPLKVGTPIQGSEKSSDGKWLLALTADGQAAFIPMSALGPYDPSAPAPAPATDAANPAPNASASSPAALPSAAANAIDALSGKARVIDTATLTVGVQQVSLAGISGEGGDAAKQLQNLIDSKGGNVDCKRQAGKYVCSENGIGDIARAVLYNGSARPAADASDDYRKQADDAKAARRGVWAKS